MSRLPQVILTVADLAASVAFYQSRLAFHLEAWEHKAHHARVLGPEGVPLLLADSSADLASLPPVPRAAPGAVVYLHSPDLTALASRLAKAGLTPEGPAVPYPGFRHLLLPDPDGYLLTFWESFPLPDEEVIRIYRETPPRLRRAAESLSAAILDLPRAPGKWSLRQTVHHLVDSDLSTFHVLRLALALPGRQINPNVWEPDQWMAGLRCQERPVGAALALLDAAHAWVLEVVEHLPDGMDRTVTWPSGYRAAVRDLLRQVGGHGLHHTLQIEAALRQYGSLAP